MALQLESIVSTAGGLEQHGDIIHDGTDVFTTFDDSVDVFGLLQQGEALGVVEFEDLELLNNLFTDSSKAGIRFIVYVSLLQ